MGINKLINQIDRRQHHERRHNQQEYLALAKDVAPPDLFNQVPQVLAGQENAGEGNVYQQPWHLLRRHRVSQQGQAGPAGQYQAEYVPLPQKIDGSGHPKDYRQHLVHGKTDEIVIPGLVSPGHVLLGDPVPHAQPRAAKNSGNVTEYGGVKSYPDPVENSGAD